MHITVFGANSMVGQLVVGRALHEGHHVHAFVHSRNPFDPHPRLTLTAGQIGDGSDLDAVETALVGADAVLSTLSTLGAFRRETDPVVAHGLRLITTAMRRCGSHRLVVLSGVGLRRPGQRTPIHTQANRMALSLMDRAAVADADRALDVLKATELAWTVVCAPTISPEGPAAYRLTTTMPSLLRTVPGPAVAAGLIDLATQDATLSPVLRISPVLGSSPVLGTSPVLGISAGRPSRPH